MKRKLLTLNLDLNTHEKCLQYLIKVRWNDIPTCTHCSCKRSSPKDKRYTCLGCGKSYSVLVGTVFESSKITLDKWFAAFGYILKSAKGISSCQLAKYIGIHRNTAWRMQFKIRCALRSKRDRIIRFIYKSLKAGLRSKNTKSLIFSIKSVAQVKRKGAKILKKRTYLMNRGIVGQYHRVSESHLQGYIDEMMFRQEHKNLSDLGFNNMMKRLLNKYLPL